ncbi:arsenate reductase ArsC [Nitrospirillum sp. BR 11828]|uniref:arsenate reductase/protein-tyrosine-phosphatase family protein n=1 Tax=Nitrospirillum sp. BR 11828 TaxID=3104325 RepID=UPI002ACAD0FA|nr:arsenate reductase ArsC [Nitrospirillum sp. BR 11828]MDZ5650545.1 arsenate reductase ArsC [Nitrospirillum sp. BR 11828]
MPPDSPMLDEPAPRPGHTDRRLSVLFVGRVNAGRSLMAEALLRHHAGHRFDAHSAGLMPVDHINPFVLARLRAEGVDTRDLAPKPLDRYIGPVAPPVDIVITVSELAATGMAGAWPGQLVTAHWALPDPDPSLDPGVAADPEAVVDAVFQDLRRRIDLLAILPAHCLLALSHWDEGPEDGLCRVG